MFSLRSPISRFFYFAILALSFSSCTSSCECEVDTLPCASMSSEQLGVIQAFENDSVKFIGSDSSIVEIIFFNVDSNVQSVSNCYSKSLGQCICEDCNSNYTVRLQHIDSGVVKGGYIRLSATQLQSGSSEELSDVSTNLRINLGILAKILQFPLTGRNSTSAQATNQQDYFPEFRGNGKVFNQVYRLYTIRYFNDVSEEIPGAIYYTAVDGIIGYENPQTNILYVRTN